MNCARKNIFRILLLLFIQLLNEKSVQAQSSQPPHAETSEVGFGLVTYKFDILDLRLKKLENEFRNNKDFMLHDLQLLLNNEMELQTKNLLQSVLKFILNAQSEAQSEQLIMLHKEMDNLNTTIIKSFELEIQQFGEGYLKARKTDLARNLNKQGNDVLEKVEMLIKRQCQRRRVCSCACTIEAQSENLTIKRLPAKLAKGIDGEMTTEVEVFRRLPTASHSETAEDYREVKASYDKETADLREILANYREQPASYRQSAEESYEEPAVEYRTPETSHRKPLATEPIENLRQVPKPKIRKPATSYRNILSSNDAAKQKPTATTAKFNEASKRSSETALNNVTKLFIQQQPVPQTCSEAVHLLGPADVDQLGVAAAIALPQANLAKFAVWCKFDCDEPASPAWTLIARQAESRSFANYMKKYIHGFGDPLDMSDYFIGFEKLTKMTQAHDSELWFEVLNFDHSYYDAWYDVVKIGDWHDGYLLECLGAYSGNAGNVLQHFVGERFEQLLHVMSYMKCCDAANDFKDVENLACYLKETSCFFGSNSTEFGRNLKNWRNYKVIQVSIRPTSIVS